MALTTHYMAKNEHGHLVFKSQLVAFRYIDGSHTGRNLGNAFLKITDDLGISHKVRLSKALHCVCPDLI